MSFRIEEKISLKNSNLFDFKKWLFLNNAKKLFPARLINSLYFDNSLRMYKDSNEGIVPRRKVRIRTYNNKFFFLSSSGFKKETKITYFNYRSKIVENIKLNKGIKGLLDTKYGFCKPNLNVIYKRSYYTIFNLRITLDEGIRYRSFNNGNFSNYIKEDKNFNVIELKTRNINSIDFLKELFPFERTRFSKYCRGIEILNLN